MEGHEDGSVEIVTYAAEIREPYMGNSVPISVHIYFRGGEIIRVELENPEGMKMTANMTDRVKMDARSWQRLTRIYRDVSP